MPVVVDTTAQRVLDVARSTLGEHEQPFGSNRTRFGEWYGMNGVAWCDIWASWVLHHGGAEEIAKSAYTPSRAQWFKDRDAWQPKGYRPKPGDLVLFDFPGDGVNRISHVGFVEGLLADGRIATLEGNTNGAGGRTGGMVMRHNRSVAGGIVGYGVITYQEDDDMAFGPVEAERLARVEKMLEDNRWNFAGIKAIAAKVDALDLSGLDDEDLAALAGLVIAGLDPQAIAKAVAEHLPDYELVKR